MYKRKLLSQPYNPAKALLSRERGTAPRKPYCPEKGIRSRESFWKRKKPPGNQPSAHHILLSLGKRRPFYPFLRSKTRKYIKKERALYQNARSKIALASHFDTTKSFWFTVGAAGCIWVQIALFRCILWNRVYFAPRPLVFISMVSITGTMQVVQYFSFSAIYPAEEAVHRQAIWLSS